MSKRMLILGASAAVLVLAAGAYGFFFRGGMPTSPVPADVRAALVPDAPRIGDFALRDQDGRPFGAISLRGQWSLLFMGYTHCPDVCPITLSLMGKLAESLRLAPDGVPVRLVFVTADPARDTAARLKAYLTAFPGPLTGVTGEEAQLERLEAQLGAFHRIDSGPSPRTGGVPDGPHMHMDGSVHHHEHAEGHGGYSVTHSADIYVIDPDGRLFARLRPPIETADWTRRILGIRSAWLTSPGRSNG